MLVVSDILRDATRFQIVGSEEFLRSTPKGSVVNVQLDYRYMKLGYYVSMHAETHGNRVIPTCLNIVDAYNNAIILARSEKRGIPVAPHIETNDMEKIARKLGYPLVLFPLNPVSYDILRIANDEEELDRSMKSLGMNYRYPVTAQALMGRLRTVKSIFGTANLPEANSVAGKCFEEFMIPLCKLYIQESDEKCYLCSMSPLKPNDLEPSDLQVIREKIEDLGESL